MTPSQPPPAMSTILAPRTALTESFAYRDRVDGAGGRHTIGRTTATAAPLVLVVDDHEDSRIIARLVLEAAGFRVREAANGVAALSLAVAIEPDVMLLDLILPEIDGWEVARRLRRDPATTNMGIIAMTALAVRDDHVRARHAGCDAVLIKPVLPKAIVETVCRYVERPVVGVPALFQV
jgi:CheY-like chemotaxis protein